MAQKRDQTLDVFKGLMVFWMIFCHTIQFFGDMDLFPRGRIVDVSGNLMAFSSFVFAFGIATSLAYLNKPFRQVWKRMLRTTLRTLGAFYISGIAMRLIRENRPFEMWNIRRILLLQDIPGYSEFLLTFALYMAVAMVLFVPLRWLQKRPLWAAGISLVCLMGCFLPVAHIENPYVGMWIGMGKYMTFPALQFAPFFLMGIAFPQRKKEYTWVWGVGALVCSAIGGFLWWRLGELPRRFPPTIGWVLLPCAGIALLMLLSWGLCKIPLGKWARYSPLIPIASMGRSTLYYLLASNLVYFAFAGKYLRPKVTLGAKSIWGIPIQTPLGAFWWTVILLLGIALTASLVNRPARVIREKAEAPEEAKAPEAIAAPEDEIS